MFNSTTSQATCPRCAAHLATHPHIAGNCASATSADLGGDE